MKELTIEEKAQRYNEALERAKGVIEQNPLMEYLKKGIEYIFPELKESEDERIRKGIIRNLEYLADRAEGFVKDELKERITWLEKQGEQKPVISDDALREGIAHFGITQYQIDNWLKKYVDVEKQGEQESEEFDDTNAKRMFIKALERVEEQNNKGYKLTDCDKNSWWEDFKAYTSCTIEQKPAEWSEENEKMFEHIIAKATLHFSSINYLDEEEINFLKSLKDRYAWRPSDEQMDALHYVTNFDYGGHKATLVSLYEQLKKLMEK